MNTVLCVCVCVCKVVPEEERLAIPDALGIITANLLVCQTHVIPSAGFP